MTEDNLPGDDLETDVSTGGALQALFARARGLQYPHSEEGQPVQQIQGQPQGGLGAARTSLMGSTSNDITRARGIEETEGKKAATLLQTQLSGLRDYKPDETAKWLSMAQNFLAPSKTGSFGESLSRVAGGLEPIVSKEAALKNQYKQQAAQMEYEASAKNAAAAAVDRQKLTADMAKMSQLRGSQGVRELPPDENGNLRYEMNVSGQVIQTTIDKSTGAVKREIMVDAPKFGLGADTAAKGAMVEGLAARKQAISGGETDLESLNAIEAAANARAKSAMGSVGPRGQGVTNPGNMRPQGASTGFQTFATPEEGLSAVDKNLQAYGAKGINTVSGIINRWAPPSENDTASYIADVSKRLGIKPDQPLNMDDPVVRQALTTAITLHEHGSSKVFGGTPATATTVKVAEPATRTTADTIVSDIQKSSPSGKLAQPEEVKQESVRTKKYLESLHTAGQDANEMVNITNQTLKNLDAIGKDAGKMASFRAGMASYKMALFPDSVTPEDVKLAGNATEADKKQFALATGQVRGVSSRPSQLEFIKSLENTINKGMTPEARFGLAQSMLEKAKAVQDEQKAVNQARDKLKYHQLATFGDKYSEVRAADVEERTANPPTKMFPVGPKGEMVTARKAPNGKYYVQNQDKTWSPVVPPK